MGGMALAAEVGFGYPQGMRVRALIQWLSVLLLIPALTGCLTHRTVSQAGQVKEQKYVIKRPVKEIIQNSR